MSATSPLSLFDCNCMVGMRAGRREGEPYALEQLRADMQACGIAEALVTHAMSRDCDPATGNREISRLLTGTSGLHACWAILPPATHELEEPSAFVREMHARKVRAVVAYPHTQTYALADWSLGPLLSALDRIRMPLLLPFGEATWEAIDRLCSSYVHLPCIVTGINYRQLRYLLPLWEKHKHLYVDLSWFSVHDGLPYLAERGLLRQVVFGTNYPLYEPGAAVAMVTFADLTDEQKQAVGGGTLRTLIGDLRKEDV